MEENAISLREKDSGRPFIDFLKDFSITPKGMDSFKDRLSKAIERLPYEQKVVLSLYYCEEMTMAEIGEILRKTERDIYQVHSHIIYHLRNEIHSLA